MPYIVGIHWRHYLIHKPFMLATKSQLPARQMGLILVGVHVRGPAQVRSAEQGR